MKTQQSYRQIFGLVLNGLIALTFWRGVNCIHVQVNNDDYTQQMLDSGYQYLPPVQPLPADFYGVNPPQQILPVPISYQNTHSVFIQKNVSESGSVNEQESKNVPPTQYLAAKETPIIIDNMQQYPLIPQVIHHYHYHGPIYPIVPTSAIQNINSQQQQSQSQSFVHTPGMEVLQQYTYLPPVDYTYISQQQQQHQQQKQQQVDNTVKLPFIPLPDGYVVVKPEGAEEAIKELHTLPDESDEVSTENILQQQHIGTEYTGLMYLPPLQSAIRNHRSLPPLSAFVQNSKNAKLIKSKLMAFRAL